MAVISKADAAAVFDLKSAALTLVAFVPKTAELPVLEAELERRFGDDSPLFDNDPVAIDLSALAGQALDVAALVALLRRYRMQPIAARGGSPEQMQAAQAAGLGEAPEPLPTRGPAREAESLAEPTPPTLTETVAFAPGATLVVDKPLRSGQRVYARGGDLVVLGVVSYGAEVIADGHIHVYAPLRGRAIAGAKGYEQARIFAAVMQPQLLSIAGIYRTTETELPPDVLGKAAQVRLDGERLVVEPLKF